MTDSTAADTGKDSAEQEATFADRLARARAIVQALEQGTTDLEAGVRLYKEAFECLRFCRERLDAVRNELELLNGEIMPAEDFLDRTEQESGN